MQRSIQTRKLYSKGMPRHSVKGNSIPKLILRRSKPSFQPSIPNIHLTSKHQPETGAVHCSPLRSSLSPLAERLLRLSSHHWGEQCTTQDVTKLWMCMHKTYTTITKVHLSGKHDVCNSHDFPKPLSPKKSMHVYTPFLLTPRWSITMLLILFQKTQMKSRSRWKSPDTKTETFAPKMNRQKSKPETFVPKIESPETKDRIHMKLNIAPV